MIPDYQTLILECAANGELNLKKTLKKIDEDFFEWVEERHEMNAVEIEDAKRSESPRWR